MAKVDFLRVETDEDVENIDIKDGQLIYSKSGKTFMDFDDERIPTGAGEMDSQMSDSSENAVQNKVIKNYVDEKKSEMKTYVDDINEFSTEEHVVGTFIDGKPLYSKWYTAEISSGITFEELLSIGSSSLYYPKIWVNNWFTTYTYSSSNYIYTYTHGPYYADSSNKQYINVYTINFYKSKVVWHGAFNSSASKLYVYFELRYTKSTD